MVVVVFLLCAFIILVIFKNNKNAKDIVIADSSIFMDGRLYNIVKTNFVSFKLIIPSFVIEELKNISESADAIAKSRAKKALSIINNLKKSGISIKILNSRLERSESSSLKIIELAKHFKAGILSKDFDLCKKASLKNIRVLNINSLEIALYPLFLPGDKIATYLVKKGVKHNQAIGYFDDKTQIIVENAKKFIGKNINLVVTSVILTPTGRIIFCKPLG
jgi:uncharacterized protein YacL